MLKTITSKADIISLTFLTQSTIVVNQQEQEDFNDDEWIEQCIRELESEQLTFH